MGSSPHTRGAPRIPARRRLRGWIIPAYAGSTHTMNISSPMGWDHPRIRGEHVPGHSGVRRREGSSPHTRGARAAPPSPASEMGIIPAYAGSTRNGCRRCYSGGGSSPHTRGALALRHLPRKLIGIIPAYAGSTTVSAAPATSDEDHPRIRGEHENRTDEIMRTPGSSPHTRGALDRGDHPSVSARIIPAYAGST